MPIGYVLGANPVEDPHGADEGGRKSKTGVRNGGGGRPEICGRIRSHKARSSENIGRVTGPGPRIPAPSKAPVSTMSVQLRALRPAPSDFGVDRPSRGALHKVSITRGRLSLRSHLGASQIRPRICAGELDVRVEIRPVTNTVQWCMSVSAQTAGNHS